MKRITDLVIKFIPFLLILTSCGERRVMKDLSDIEFYIDARPDSALIALRQIDTTILGAKATKAKFALLHAMALDKNYIDTVDTRIIQPAVEYYDCHGNQKERLKALMYLGTAQFNAGSYNQAIVTFGQAVEQSKGISDYNLKGVLYSKMAETFIQSQEYVQANDYLDKAIQCFEDSERPDQRTLVQIMKAVNYLRLMNWDKSEELFKSLLSDDSLSDKQKGSVEGYYAMMISYNPSMSDTTALCHFNKAIAYNGYLENVDQYCAYAYLLGCIGKKEESDLLFDGIDLSDYKNNYSHDYWQHRLYIHNKDYKQAYYSLLSARQIVDSISMVNHSYSATNAQRVQMESLANQRQLKIQSQRWMILALSFLSILVITLTIDFYWRRRRKSIEEHDRMEIVIDLLNHQIREIKAENQLLVKEKSKARFAVIASLFEDVYHLSEKEKNLTNDRLYEIINERTKILGHDEDAQKEFERVLNEESGDIMASFRKEYPMLTPDEYRMASYIFAGFDNTNIMLIMGISTLEYTRVKKNRLKNRIQKQPSPLIDTYLGYF